MYVRGEINNFPALRLIRNNWGSTQLLSPLYHLLHLADGVDSYKTMDLRQTPVFVAFHFSFFFIFFFFFFFFFCIFSSLLFSISSAALIDHLSLLPFHPQDNISINCGFSGNYTAFDGRHWIGDSRSLYFVSQGLNKKSISLAAAKPSFFSHSDHDVPYTYARFSQTQFTYVFPVSPGPKFVRLHFYPASYRANFQRNNGFFTVKAGPFTLLQNFSASLTADALGITTVSKEFCLNVKANRSLRITFSPSRTSPSDKVYAFVNGIEVVSMPNGLYYSEKNADFTFLSRRTALETLYRLNIGGSSIPFANDAGMFREWSDDSRFFLHSRVLPLETTIPIKYKNVPNFVAPQNVYQTSWALVPSKIPKENTNFTWKLPVDQGFRYLIRFHFCELDYEIKEIGQRAFRIYIDNHMAEPDGDIIKWSGEIGAATYKDYNYVIEGDRMAGNCNILISICSFPIHHDESTFETIDVILRGLEILKLSNPDNNLAVPNPVVSFSLAPKPLKGRQSMYMAAGGNTIAMYIVILLLALNFVVYKLRAWADGEDFAQYEGLCEIFTFSELRSGTKNFDNFIGKGGFGSVHKGCIRGIEVAVKRLDPGSKQGSVQFLAEIEALTKLRNTNLVTLEGYCKEGREMILVYEYMAHGTLADHLYKLNPEGTNSQLLLSWEQRLKICIDVARGLEYLHNYNGWVIIHLDIKSTNILLDQNLVAKIADFGLCKMVQDSHFSSHIYTSVKGTHGYMEKEYFHTGKVTKKSDVYSFGVVLWEVLCGRPAIKEDAKEPGEGFLAKWVEKNFEERKIDQIVDPRLKGKIPESSLELFKEVANLCIHDERSERPSMTDVVTSLERALALA